MLARNGSSVRPGPRTTLCGSNPGCHRGKILDLLASKLESNLSRLLPAATANCTYRTYAACQRNCILAKPALRLAQVAMSVNIMMNSYRVGVLNGTRGLANSGQF